MHASWKKQKNKKLEITFKQNYKLKKKTIYDSFHLSGLKSTAKLCVFILYVDVSLKTNKLIIQ